MAYRMKGAPMKRNFGIDKPGVPNTGEFVDDVSAGFATNNTSNTNAGIVTPPASTVTPPASTSFEDLSNDEKKQSYYEQAGVNPDGTKKLSERNDGLKGGLLDNWIRKNQGKSFREVLGLSKEQIAKRKAEKNAKIEVAKSAVGSGTETLKQAKLVDRNTKKVNRKTKRKTKKDARDQEKLVKYKARRSKKAAKKFKKNTVVENGKTYDKPKKTNTSTKPTDAELMAHHEANRKKQGKSKL
tara:strand:- start:1272 stop:1994 length:723 start_codon:yes stop_codon:yes gene_type:complete